MTRLRGTRAATGDGAVQVQASTQLMDNFVYATDVADGTDLVSVQQADGTYALLYIGGSGNVMSLRQDLSSDTGWTEEPLGNSFTAGQVVGGVDGNGDFVAFAVGPNAAAPDIYTSSRSGGVWSAWQAVAADANVPPFVQVQTLAALTAGGAVELYTILGPSPEQSGTGTLWQVAWNQAAPSWTSLAPTDQTIIEPCTIAGIGQAILFANTAAASPTRLDLFALAAGAAPGAQQPVGQTLSFTALATGLQSDGNSAIFIADTGAFSGVRQIQYLDGGNPGGGFIQVDTDTTAATLAVMAAGATPLTLFALDRQNVLHLVADPTSPVEGDDFDFSLKLTTMVTALDQDGNAELVGYVPGKGLMRVWAEPAEGSQGRSGWSRAPVEYDPVNSTLTQSSTYRTTLVFSDANGVFLPNQPIELRATEIVGGSIGGEFVMFGPVRPITVNTDGRGRVRITLPTGALDCAQLSARVPGLTADDEDFQVSPDAPIKNRLANATLAEVQQFINPEYLSSAAAVQQALQEAMANVTDGSAPVVRRRVGARPDLKTPIPQAARRRQAHSFSVVNGQATFRLLSSAEAQERRAAMAAMHADGFFDWFEDAVETVADALEDAVDWTYEHVIEPVAEGISVAIKFVSDAITVVWNGIIETVEDAFRFVKTVFNAVKTFFVRLYNFLAWLLSSARKDIWATKTQFENMVNQGFTSLAGYAGQGASVSPTFFAALATQVDSIFSQIEGSVGTMDANAALSASLPGGGDRDSALDTVLEMIEDADASSSWLFDQVMDLLGLDVDFDLPGTVVSSAQAIVAQVGTAVGDEIAGLITGFLSQLETLASSVENLGNALLSTILAEAKALLLAVLRLLDTLVQAVLAFFHDNLAVIGSSIFGASIGGVLLQDLYDLVNPGSSEDLTVLRLGCLVGAFVSTVLYKIIMDEVPFPSERAESARPAADTPLIVAGILQVVWLLHDAALDGGSPAPKMKWIFFVLAVTPPLIIQLLIKPAGSPSFGNDQDKSKWVAWFTGFGTTAWKLLWGCLMVGGVVQKGPRRSPVGAAGLCVCGTTSLAMNAWKSYENGDNAWAWISSLVSPLSAMVKPFGVQGGGRLLVITDVISDAGGGIAKIMKGAGVPGNDDSRPSALLASAHQTITQGRSPMTAIAQDPTLQTSGALEVNLKLVWNAAYINPQGAFHGMPVSFNSIMYGPPNELPPPWASGNQYSAISGAQVPGFGAMLPIQGWTSQAGYVQCVRVSDMSSNAVVAGKTYAFAVDLSSLGIQLYFMLTGGSGGTTVTPGFGLLNLGTNPNAWTYITPTQFNGAWEIGLLSPFSDAPVWLSVEYAPPKDYGQGIVSRLIFTCTGGTVTQSPSVPNPWGGASFLNPTPVGTQQIHDRSDSHVLCDRNGAPLRKADRR